jgi:Fe2+ transport system protein B
MLAELAILNAAYGVIKTTFTNGKELLNAGTGVHDYLSAEQQVKKKLDAGEGDVVTRFKAKKALQKAEEELKFMLNKESLGGYHEWLQFKADYYNEQKEIRKKILKQQQKRKAALREKIHDIIKVTFGVVAFFTVLTIVGVTLYVKGYY